VLYFVLMNPAHRTLLCLCLIVPVSPAGAQTRVGLRTGITTSSRLVRDSLGTEAVESRINPAAVLGVLFDTRVRSDILLGASIAVGRSNLVRQTVDEKVAIARLTIWHPSISVGHPLSPWLEGHARLGVLVYRPDRQLGTIFGTSAPTATTYGAVVSASRPLGGRLLGSIDVAYDYHRFGTTTLRIAGFVGETSVHRLTIGATVRHRRTDDGS